MGEYQKAIDALEYSFIINPRFERGYYDCAEYLVESKQHEKALEIYNEALEIFGPEIDVLMSMANCQFELVLIDQAKRTLFEVLEIDNYSDEALYLLAKCYLENKDYTSAVKVLKKAISIENGVEEYFHALGKAYHHLNEIDKAGYYYNRAAEQGLEISTYWENYIIFLLEQGKYKQAYKVYRKADKYTFSYRLQYLAAACHLLMGNKKLGLDILEESLIEDFKDHTILFDLPKELIENSTITSMISYFEKESK